MSVGQRRFVGARSLNQQGDPRSVTIHQLTRRQILKVFDLRQKRCANQLYLRV